ncbi:MAG: hypothetical protein ACODAQ_01655 [Phycisphaeraceae bacterium]
MRNRSGMSAFAVPAVALLMTMLVGCGRGDGGDSADLEAALALLDASAQDYATQIPASADEPPTQSIEQFRQAKLDEALPKLEAAVESTRGGERELARRLIADVHAVAGRHTASEAMAVYTAFGAGARSDLLTQLQAVERAAGRVELFQQDRSVVERELNEVIEQQQAQRAQRQQAIEQLQQQIDQLQAERDEFREKASAARTEQHRLRSEADVAEGGESYELLDQAATAARRADEAEAQAEQRQARIDRLSAEQSVEQAQVERIDAAIANLREQIETWRQTEQQREAQLEEAQQQVETEAAALVERYNAAHERFMRQVHEPMNAATDRFAEAVEQLEQVRSADVEAQLSLAQQELARLQSEHRGAIEDFKGITEMLASRLAEIAPDQADALNAGARVLDEAQQSLSAAQE